MLPTTDACITSGLTEAVQRILPALEQFLRFEDHDLAARARAQKLGAALHDLDHTGTHGAKPGDA